MQIDLDAYREQSRENWGRMAQGWENRREWMLDITGRVNDWLAEKADPQPGQTFLDIAAQGTTLPDIPAVGDFVPGYEASQWYGVGAPRSTPDEIVDKLNKEINAALADPRMKARLADLGGTVLQGSPTDFAKLIADDTQKWAKVVKFSGAKAD